jgi:hypothetical protein
VFSDDPFTDRIEPTIPYSLGGDGAESRLRPGQELPHHLSPAQDHREREGLAHRLQHHRHRGLQGRNELRPDAPSLTANFGDISAGDTAIGRWLLTSTLQGLFIDYSARFEHIDGLGNPRLSLIDEVTRSTR